MASDDDAATEIYGHILRLQIERMVARRELAELGITSASPADVSSWIEATPRARRRLGLAWAVLSAEMFEQNEINPREVVTHDKHCG